ncbi:hypothetical protein RRG08_011344 [Elysia crispata]|uniref:glycerophosphocholine cholinephosphodiesterase n=1 Tax=Elysia crispata TaxID=231223 RepID=A0AAE1ABC2_9GAST|nr:hypothetical protein RRG08_011344 [Elysia crispata]
MASSSGNPRRSMLYHVLPVLVVFLSSSIEAKTRNPPNRRLMVLLVDGFRWDYADKHNLANFKRLESDGAKAGYMQNDYPTLSYPNYYTLMTGLHTENHAMTGNFMYDPDTKKFFLIGTNKDQFLPLWWDHGEPLWVTADLQNKSSYMFFWPGCEVTIRGRDPTFCDAYSKVPSIQEVADALDQGFLLITNGTADMVAVYSEQPDHYGHKYGPDAENTRLVLQDIDREVGKLLDRIAALTDDEKFNLVIVSDHGMTTIDPSRTINITEALTSEPGLYITIMESAALASIYAPNQEAEDKVHTLLKDFSDHMQVYRRQEIPDRFYYKNGPFVSRITCVADLGWTILQPLQPEFPKKGLSDMQGFHGYDNGEIDMRGIFYAYGPYFQPGSRVDHIQAIDPYSVMCDILELAPSPNNGTLSVFEPLKAVSAGSRDCPSVLPAWFFVVTLLAWKAVW